MSAVAVARAACAAALAIASLACAGAAIDLSELPAAPIVILHRDAETARRRAEILGDTKGRKDGGSRGKGVARISDVQRLLGRDVRAEFAELAGRLSTFDPHTEEVKPIDAAPKGAEPLGRSADRRLLIFRTWREDLPQVLALDESNGQVGPLTPYGVNAIYGTVARDGRIAYSAIQTGPAGASIRLFLVTPGGGAPRPLTAGPVDKSPVFSPDGNDLVFVTRAADGSDAIARLDPWAEDPVVRILARGKEPVFTPDGAWIVYSAQSGRGHRLWKMRLDGSGKLPVGEGSTEDPDETHPAVSPDGRYVAYVSEREDRFWLRLRRFDGTGDRALLDEGDGTAPVW